MTGKNNRKNNKGEGNSNKNAANTSSEQREYREKQKQPAQAQTDFENKKGHSDVPKPTKKDNTKKYAPKDTQNATLKTDSVHKMDSPAVGGDIPQKQPDLNSVEHARSFVL